MDTLVALGTGVARSTHECQPVAAVVPDGSTAPLLRSQRDTGRFD